MNLNITIGQYYPADSVLHSLDARVKLLGTLVYATALFVINALVGYVFAAFCLAALIIASKVPFKMLIRGLRVVIFIFAFTSLLNIFFTNGRHILFEWGILKISVEGIINALRVTVRLIMLIVGASLLTLTTTPVQLTGAIEYSLKPLSRIGVPAHEIAMMMTIALRFIPTLMEETDKIMKAQLSRGADFDTGGIVKKAKALIPLLVPLFISAFRRADDLALAMEARCYRGGEGRTKMREPKLVKADKIALLATPCFVGIIVLFNILL